MNDDHGVSFGPFCLRASKRLLTKDGVPVPLGSRALDILLLLVERAGEVVSKDDLIARAWPNMTVEESGLRHHVAALRKALGDGRGVARYVANTSGRGYSFVAPLTQPTSSPAASGPRHSPLDATSDLPHRLTPMMGRDEAVRAVCQKLAAHRLVTLHGPGGIGKTTVGLEVGRGLLSTFEGSVHFVDLGPVRDPALVASAVATALGIAVQAGNPTQGLISFLSERRMLIILDCCEHVIGAAAMLAEQILMRALRVTLLATSREPLRVPDEHLYRVDALDGPPPSAVMTAAALLSFPAARLFVERAAAAGYRVKSSDDEAIMVAEICRKLDGNPLAIELVAGRTVTFGLPDIAAHLDSRLTLLWQGRRTAVPRHQTLHATLDWSHELIPDVERAVLRRLSVFAGPFTLPAAQAIAADESLDAPHVAEALGQLVAKSLVQVHADGATRHYRLLDTMRAYARAKLADSGEGRAMARRHAAYYWTLLDRAHATTAAGDRAVRTAVLGNVRAAQDWCFADGGDAVLGVQLVAAAAPLLLELSLLGECRRWAEQALALLDPSAHGTPLEMELLAALGQSLMLTSGNSQYVQAVLERALAIADELNDRQNQFRLLSRLHLLHRRTGEFGRLLPISRRAESIAASVADPVAATAANVLLGVAHHLVGNQAEAAVHLDASARQLASLRPVNPSHFGFHRGPLIPLCRVLWLRGYPDQAVAVADRLATQPAANSDTATFCIALIWGASVYQWIGDWDAVTRISDRLIDHAAQHALEPYKAVGLGLRGEILVNRGETEHGVDLLRRAVSNLRAERYELYIPAFNRTLAEVLAKAGRLDHALETMDDTIARVRANGKAFDMPELLRIKGELLVRNDDDQRAEPLFRQATELADRQSALSWRLRAATSLARLLLRHGRRDEAGEALAGTYGRFNEGFGSADLVEARQLLGSTGHPVGKADLTSLSTSSQT